MRPIWIVDDDPSIRFVLERALQREHVPTRSFERTRQVIEALEALDDEPPERRATNEPGVLVSDIRMPGGSGLELLAEVRRLRPQLPVVIMTAYSDLDSAVGAFQGGAFDYLAKPFDVAKAVALICRAYEEREEQQRAEEHGGGSAEMLGQAPAMQDLFRAIGRLSPSQVTVLITGESGTGKELVARALHRHSPRAAGPFVAINTAAIPKDLLESELFGHERGAFTGAQTLRRGRFEQAEGGTLFLDEIGDMPLELQTRLLRVLSDGQFYRVGGHAPMRANVRVIAATHQDLEQRVRDGAFREDLFHRLNVIRLRLPRLAERREDIPMLARHFLQRSAQQLGVEAKRLSEAALAALQRYDYPGNVRQLENICHWLTVMAPAQTVDVKDLPPELAAAVGTGHDATAAAVAAVADERVAPQASGQTDDCAAPLPQAQPLGVATQSPTSPRPQAARPAAEWASGIFDEAVERLLRGERDVWDTVVRQVERQLLLAALAVTHGRRVDAAARLGIGRNTLTRKTQELGIGGPEAEPTLAGTSVAVDRSPIPGTSGSVSN